MMRLFWTLPFLVGGIGILCTLEVLPCCFAIPHLLGLLCTILVRRYVPAVAWIGLAALSLMGFVSLSIVQHSPVERARDDAMGEVMVGGINLAILFAYLVIVLIRPPVSAIRR